MSPQLPSNIDSVCDIIDYRLSIIMYFWCLPLFCCMYLCHCDGHLTETAARLPVAVHYRVSDLLNIIDFETTVSGCGRLLTTNITSVSVHGSVRSRAPR